MLSLKLMEIFDCKSSLGEGLFVKNKNAAWVDINKKLIYISEGSNFIKYKTQSRPSVIFEFNEHYVKFGSDNGLIKFCRKTGKEKELLRAPQNISNEYRSNDGGFCGNHELLGFMHRDQPDSNKGYIYKFCTNSWKLLDDTIYIPNTFLEIEPLKVLISDSLKGQIWLFELDKDGSLLSKTLWAKLDDGLAPDGGCLVGDYILIALWDDKSIGVFNKQGSLLKKLEMPILRPTNCKFDKKSYKLWVTSASEGLNKKQICLYPLSGNTFIFDLKL